MLTSGNYGTMQRLRAQSSVLMLPVAAAGLALVLGQVQRRRGRTRPVEQRQS
jgi:hypothetical protein